MPWKNVNGTREYHNNTLTVKGKVYRYKTMHTTQREAKISIDGYKSDGFLVESKKTVNHGFIAIFIRKKQIND